MGKKITLLRTLKPVYFALELKYKQNGDTYIELTCLHEVFSGKYNKRRVTQVASATKTTVTDHIFTTIDKIVLCGKDAGNYGMKTKRYSVHK